MDDVKLQILSKNYYFLNLLSSSSKGNKMASKKIFRIFFSKIWKKNSNFFSGKKSKKKIFTQIFFFGSHMEVFSNKRVCSIPTAHEVQHLNVDKVECTYKLTLAWYGTNSFIAENLHMASNEENLSKYFFFSIFFPKKN